MSNPTAPNPSAPIPWWRVKAMWLVVGGPLAVVIASMVTLTLAIKHPDPVLDKRSPGQALKPAEDIGDAARAEALIKLQPAQQARNHAASPVVPQSKP
jgi:hypothetical protein